jgi:hypothetical protein
LNSATRDRVEQWLRHPAWGPWLKLVLFAALAAALVHQVIHRQDWAEAWTAMRQSGAEARWPLLLLVLALVPFNWGLEAEKWRRLISPLERIGFRRALRATLSGVTLGLFTPNRIGEYGGRVWYLSPGRRMAAVPLSLMGSWAQILVTGMLGALSGILFYYRFARIQQWPFLGKPVPWLMAIAVLSLVALVAYLLFPLWIGKVGHWSWWKRLPRTLRPPLRLLESLHPALLGQAFGLSAARYLVFAAQYLILLRVFNLALGWGQGFVALGTLFLMQSLLPSLSAFEWLKRGNLALFVFGVFIPDSAHAEWSILAASTGLWAINLVLPALLGYAFLLGQSGAPKQLPTKHPFSATPSAAASAAATHAPHRSPSNALPESAQTPSAARRSGEGKARPEARP